MILANIFLYMNICVINFKKKKDIKRLECYLQSTVVWTLIMYLITEMLSLWHVLHVAPLRIVWAMIDVLLLIWLILQTRGSERWEVRILPEVGRLLKCWSNWILMSIGLATSILAVVTVPYNWDSMTYRLSRISYWAQHGSVEHFATSSIRMIANPPLGEFIQLHTYLVQGCNDFSLTWIQCMAYLTCSAIVYGIARKIKCDRVFAFLATLLFMSMPIAFAEALNTQVDLVATLWLLIFTYFILDFIYAENGIIWSKENVFKVIIMGLCVAWGYLTKPCVCVAMVIMCFWLLVNCILRRDKFHVLVRLALTAGVGAIGTMGWEIGRNIKTFHAISSPMAGQRQLIGTLQPNYVFVNLLKNLVHNLPNVYLSESNSMISSLMWKISNFLHVELNAESISEDGRIFELNRAQEYGHDMAVNPIIVWLLLICILYGFFELLRRKNISGKWYRSYIVMAATSFIVFCCVLRWEPFVTRYMLAFLALLCPGIAECLQRFTKDKECLQKGIIGFIVGICLLDVTNMTVYHRNVCVRFGADEKPSGYFALRSDDYQPCLEICKFITENGYTNLGIFQGGDDFEYPYWAILHNKIERMEHVNMYDESLVYADKTYQPECIIWLGTFSENEFEWNDQSYGVGLKVDESRYVLVP